MLIDLDVAKSHSRPHVSDDNPFSESQFRTMKYRPEFPVRFASLEAARAHCQAFFAWYNTSHRHSGIGLMTPESVHYGYHADLTIKRNAALRVAFEANPARFKNVMPRAPIVPASVWINPPSTEPMALEINAQKPLNPKQEVSQVH